MTRKKFFQGRREFLQQSILFPSTVTLGSLLPQMAFTADFQSTPPDSDRSVLLKGGVVLTMDQLQGDFDQADILIEDGLIALISASIDAPNAQLIDASNMIVMPGFVDSHRHMWQGQVRNLIPNGTLNDYLQQILFNARTHYRPEDVYIGDLLSSLSALNAGITTLLDWSHIGNSPEHTDAAIMGLQESGLRAVYAYGGGSPGPQNQFPADIRRLRREHFASDDQLLTLAMAGGTNPDEWAVAREVAAPISSHINAAGSLLPLAEFMGPDNTYIHCNLLTDEEFDLIASTGGGVSISGPVEMEMGHGEPPYQQVIDRNIAWSFSNDVETEIPSDFFTQMQHAFTLQRMKIFSRQRKGETELPAMITAKEILNIATLGGAKVNHLDQKIGSLSAGKEADIIMLDMDQINVMPVNNAYGAVVLGMDSSNVKNVLVKGRAVKWEGRLVNVDMTRIRTLALQSQEYIQQQSGWSSSRL